MKYNFDEIVPRRGTNSYKWDSSDRADMIPMWVADMDFRTAPCIIETLHKRIDHAVFGYTRVGDEYYNAVTNWFSTEHGLDIKKEWIIYTSGVVPAVSAIIKALTEPGDKVIVQTPVYNCFFSSIRNNDCEALSNPLIACGDTYKMDYDDLERKAADPKAKVLILCNPHNPAGRVWTRDELVRLGEICIRHGVTVIDDGIHCEFVYKPHKFVAFGSISDEFLRHSVTCLSPSKAYNLAGLQIANIVASNDKMRRRINRAININEVCDVNPFGVLATIAAYSSEGREWLHQLIDYLQSNYEHMKQFCKQNLPQFPLADLQGTYLVWMDCRSLGLSSEDLYNRLKSEAGLWLNYGTMYGAEGEGFMRWNIACPKSVLAEGLERFQRFVKTIDEQR